jgi:hypothetical protein
MGLIFLGQDGLVLYVRENVGTDIEMVRRSTKPEISSWPKDH